MLEEKRLASGLSQADVCARALDKPDNSAFQSIRRGASPSVHRLHALAEALDLELYFGPRRPILSDEQILAASEEFVRVKRHDIRLAAGNGLTTDNPDRLAAVAFRSRWMRDKGLVADQCSVVAVQGDSMSPTLRDGDLVLIDQSNRPIRSMDIYAFVDTSGDARVKRIEVQDEQLLIRSDNVAFPTEIRHSSDITDSFQIIGRVVWFGHEFT